MTPEDTVRAYFAAYSEGRPERFDEIVAPDYVDYGHTPPGHGPQGARDDYENAVKFAGGVLVYDIDALVARDGTTRRGLDRPSSERLEFPRPSLYRVAGGKLRKSARPSPGRAPARRRRAGGRAWR